MTQALRAEAIEAQKDVEDIQSLCSSQGWDLSKADNDTEDPQPAWEACKKLLRSRELREIFRKFGNKFRTLALAAQEQKPVGKGFVAIDRTVGGDIEKMPPDELWLLSDPMLEALAVQAIAEGTLAQEEHQEEFEREQGDMVALMDISGSTAGSISQFIKGSVLGLQAVAQAQKRRLWAIPFQSGVHGTIDLTKPSPQELMRFAAIQSNGGTNFAAALFAGIETVRKSGNADEPPDIIMVTDGIAQIAREVKEVLKKEMQSLGARLKVIYIGVDQKELRYKDIGEIAGPGNEIFLASIADWKKFERVFEQL